MGKEKLMFIRKHPLLFTNMGRSSYTYRYLEFWDYVKYLPQIILNMIKKKRRYSIPNRGDFNKLMKNTDKAMKNLITNNKS